MSTLSHRPHTRSAQGEARPCAGRHQGTPHAAGIDVGAQEIGACVPNGKAQQRVRTFGAYTTALQTLAAWRVACGSQPGALESPGVSWMPLCEELEARGRQCGWISARSLTRV